MTKKYTPDELIDAANELMIDRDFGLIRGESVIFTDEEFEIINSAFTVMYIQRKISFKGIF